MTKGMSLPFGLAGAQFHSHRPPETHSPNIVKKDPGGGPENAPWGQPGPNRVNAGELSADYKYPCVAAANLIDFISSSSEEAGCLLVPRPLKDFLFL